MPAGWPANPVSVSCLDSAAATSGNPTTQLAILNGNTATLPASVMRPAAAIACTFTNTATARIAVDKTASATAGAGGSIVYGLSFANTGPVATGTTLVVSEQLPPGVVANSVVPGTGVTSVSCGTLPSAPGALLNCTMTLPAGGIPATTGVRGFTLNATAPIVPTGTVLTNYASTNVNGAGLPVTAAGPGCVSSGTVSCDNAQTTIVVGPAAGSQSGVRVVTDNQLANGTAQDVLEAFIRDESGTPVQAGTVVTFGATPNVAFNGGAVGAAGSCTTTAAGLCQVRATSTVAAVYSTTQVTVGGAVLSGNFSVGEDSYLPSPQPYRFGSRPTVTIRKTSLGGSWHLQLHRKQRPGGTQHHNHRGRHAGRDGGADAHGGEYRHHHHRRRTAGRLCADRCLVHRAWAPADRLRATGACSRSTRRPPRPAATSSVPLPTHSTRTRRRRPLRRR